MTLRALFLFIHVVFSMGVFGSLAIEGALLWRLGRLTGTAQRRHVLNRFRLFRVLIPLTLAPTVMSGMYLVRTVWGWRAAWINTAFASLVFAVVAGGATTALRIARLQRAGVGRGSSGPYRDDGRDAILSVSFVMRIAMFIGIVFLMTVKPGLETSLIAMSTATAAGLVSSVAILFTGNTVSATERHVPDSECPPEVFR
jgi:hypothetical protein